MKAQILDIVLTELKGMPSRPGVPKEPLGEGTGLFGKRGLLDSIGLVSLLIAVEQAVEDAFNVSITIVSEKAMSQERSPFRTIGSLVDWVDGLVREAGGNA